MTKGRKTELVHFFSAHMKDDGDVACMKIAELRVRRCIEFSLY